MWNFQDNGTVTSALDNACLTASLSTLPSNVEADKCDGSDRQKWFFNVTDNTLRNHASKGCLSLGSAVPGTSMAWAAESVTGASYTYVALFNTASIIANVSVPFSTLGLSYTSCEAVDVWTGKIGVQTSTVTAELNSHASKLYRLDIAMCRK